MPTTVHGQGHCCLLRMVAGCPGQQLCCLQARLVFTELFKRVYLGGSLVQALPCRCCWCVANGWQFVIRLSGGLCPLYQYNALKIDKPVLAEVLNCGVVTTESMLVKTVGV